MVGKLQSNIVVASAPNGVGEHPNVQVRSSFNEVNHSPIQWHPDWCGLITYHEELVRWLLREKKWLVLESLVHERLELLGLDNLIAVVGEDHACWLVLAALLLPGRC